jgi:hypothetical protein
MKGSMTTTKRPGRKQDGKDSSGIDETTCLRGDEMTTEEKAQEVGACTTATHEAAKAGTDFYRYAFRGLQAVDAHTVLELRVCPHCGSTLARELKEAEVRERSALRKASVEQRLDAVEYGLMGIVTTLETLALALAMMKERIVDLEIMKGPNQ